MSRARTLLSHLAGWDISSWLAAGLCLVPFAIMVFGGPPRAGSPGEGPPLWQTLLWSPVIVAGVILFLPVVAAPQLVNLILIRRARSGVTKALLLLLSAIVLFPYARFMATADLVSTSTASLAAVFYPLRLAIFAVPLSVAIWVTGRMVEPRRR